MKHRDELMGPTYRLHHQEVDILNVFLSMAKKISTVDGIFIEGVEEIEDYGWDYYFWHRDTYIYITYKYNAPSISKLKKAADETKKAISQLYEGSSELHDNHFTISFNKSKDFCSDIVLRGSYIYYDKTGKYTEQLDNMRIIEVEDSKYVNFINIDELDSTPISR